MTSQQSLDRIRELLLTLPGVTSAIVARISDPDRVFVSFHCSEMNSLCRIAVSATGANVSFSLGHFFIRSSVELGIAHDVPFQGRITDEGTEVPSHVEIFGVYLSVELEKMGLLTTGEVDQLHSQWNTRLTGRIQRPPNA